MGVNFSNGVNPSDGVIISCRNWSYIPSEWSYNFLQKLKLNPCGIGVNSGIRMNILASFQCGGSKNQTYSISDVSWLVSRIASFKLQN